MDHWGIEPHAGCLQGILVPQYVTRLWTDGDSNHDLLRAREVSCKLELISPDDSYFVEIFAAACKFLGADPSFDDEGSVSCLVRPEGIGPSTFSV